MTLGGPAARPQVGSLEETLLHALRSGGYGLRYDDNDGVHRIVAPVDRGEGNTVVGMIVMREKRIMYAEFNRRVYPWWGRSDLSPEYVEAFDRLAAAVQEGRRK